MLASSSLRALLACGVLLSLAWRPVTGSRLAFEVNDDDEDADIKSELWLFCGCLGISWLDSLLWGNILFGLQSDCG